jgi:acetyl esterase/lipase
MRRRTSTRRTRTRIGLLVALVAVVIAITTILTTGAGAAAGSVVAKAQTVAVQVEVEQDVVWRTADGVVLTLDAYVPTSAGTADEERAVVLLVHGGGWSGGDKSDLATQAEALAELGYVAVTVEYRLAPEHPYPAAAEDVQAAVAWLRERTQVTHYGIDPDRIGVLGVSAGGHLAELLGTLGSGSTERGSRVAAVVSWSGVADLTTVDLDVGVLGCATNECPDVAAAASPITHVDATDAPTLLVTSVGDGIVPMAQSEEMDAALAAAGVDHQLLVLPGSGHATQLSDAAWATTVAFLEQHLHPGRTAA